MERFGPLAAAQPGQECLYYTESDSVHLDYRGLPGGGLYWNNEGKVLTHEGTAVTETTSMRGRTA